MVTARRDIGNERVGMWREIGLDPTGSELSCYPIYQYSNEFDIPLFKNSVKVIRD